jgi:DNA processing protein
MSKAEVLQATLLLNCYFNSSEVKTTKPLTPTEYARFALWLHQNNFTPADLLHSKDDVLASWQDPKKKITAERITSLMSRGASMGFALEHWAKHGIWVLSRTSSHYPKGIRQKIGNTRPPILFGVGNQELLNKIAIGFVGSRSTDAADDEFTKQKVELAVSQGYAVVSGGAKGIDQAAMTSALNCGGESIGILADSLLRASASKVYRQGLKDNRLALISPFYPESGFNTGNAMARNKYIYSMAQAVVVVKSDYNKGGTWTGAVENIKKHWSPLLVRQSTHDGNQELLKLGAIAMDESYSDFHKLPELSALQTNQSQSDLLSTAHQPQTDDMFAALVEPARESNNTANKELEKRGASTLVPIPVESPKQIKDKSELEANPPQENSSENLSDVEQNQAKELNTNNIFDRYGAIFSLFFEGVTQIAQPNGQASTQLVQDGSDETETASKNESNEITYAELSKIYPELTESLIKRWLKELESEGYLAKKGRKLIYTLTDKNVQEG